jgi:hypothetical protein
VRPCPASYEFDLNAVVGCFLWVALGIGISRALFVGRQ